MLSRKGVPRVVWERQRNGCNTDNEDQVDLIPFLSVARSLGDFWSFNPRTKQFVVSPRPDVQVLPLELSKQKFVVVATDGLWNVMTPTEVVQFIWDYEHNDEECHQPKDVVRAVINESLRRWNSKNLLADNIAVLIAFLSEEDSSSVSGLSSSSCPINGDMTTSDSPSSSSPSPQTGINGDLREHLESPSSPGVIKHVSKTKSGSTTYYKETLPDGVTIEYQTRIKVRHRKKDKHRSPKESKSKGQSGQELPPDSPEMSTLNRPVKRERTESDDLESLEPSVKRGRADPDSGCEASMERLEGASSEEMETKGSSFPVVPVEEHSSDSSSGVFSDITSEGLSDPAAALG